MPHFGDSFLSLTETHVQAPPKSPEGFHEISPDTQYQSCPCTCQCGCPCSGSSRKSSDAMTRAHSLGAVSEPLQIASPDVDAMSSSSASSRRSSVNGDEGTQDEFTVEAGDLGWYGLREIGRLIERQRFQPHQLVSILPGNCNLPPSAYVSPARSAILSPISMSVEACSSGQRSMESSVSQLSLPPPGSPALAGMGAGVMDQPHQQMVQIVLVPVAIQSHDGNYPISWPGNHARNAVSTHNQHLNESQQNDFW
ncbi:hypothetical protein K431DRAFT_281431 [Polychaeton citri CBS 116435]|uniref:Uncharacterized protein n=1 Tax=Polychaeton citri CBS 116435 TaxID=1314669 RepID=A0A9P4QEI6_9PEZI|nr:hypothetical protein K431DRAFT_281431 [Polychaeton citri CBS 116435]